MVDTKYIDINDLFSGKVFNATWQLTDDGSAVDISSYGDFTWTCRKEGSNSNALSVTMTKSDASAGKVSIGLTTTQTAGLKENAVYHYQITGVDGSGDDEVYVTGRFTPRTTY